jgi:hypothetical protein
MVHRPGQRWIGGDIQGGGLTVARINMLRDFGEVFCPYVSTRFGIDGCWSRHMKAIAGAVQDVGGLCVL